jgi:hypothetical protein
MSESTELALIENISEATAPAIYVKGGLSPFLDAVKAEVGAEVPDLTTRKGRDRIASLAAKVSRSKTAVVKPGRDYLRRLKEQPKIVEEELRTFERDMDALRDETRKPLTEWEEVEAARIEAHQESIQHMVNLAHEPGMMSADELRACIAEVEKFQLGESWEEFEAEAGRTKEKSLTVLRNALVVREKHDAELAAIAKFQAEQAERDAQAERDRIAREATERATREAEARAKAEREAAEQRERDAQVAAERRELELKLEAEASARRELEAKQRADQAERDAIEQKAAAERARVAAEQQAAQDKIDAQARQEAAVEDERKAALQRQADEAARVEREAKAREADRAHKGSVLKAAKESIMGAGLSEEQAKAVVKLIAAGQVPNVSIKY